MGYRASYEIDASRTFFPETEGQGAAMADRRRPVPVRIWYPAKPSRAKPITLGGVGPIDAAAPRLKALDKEWAQRNAGIHAYAARMYGSTESGRLERLLASPMRAVRNAPPLAGRFPLVVYGGGAGFAADENALLWEHLASHGYVVVAVPAQGARSVAYPAVAAELETLTRDMEFALGLGRAFPSADPERIGAMGFSYGGMAALLMASRNTDIDAVVGLDTSITSSVYGRALAETPTYAPGQVTAPLLEFHAVGPNLSRSYLDAVRYSDRRSFEIAGLNHVDFTHYPVPFHLLGGRSPEGMPLEVRRGWYEAMAARTLDFLNAVLKGDRAAAARLDADLAPLGGQPVSVVRAPPLPRPPSSAELLEVFARSAAAGEAQVTALHARDPLAPALDRDAMNRMGYALLERGAAPSALSVFIWNARQNPRAPGLIDSLADGFAAAGRQDCAAAAYRRVLDLLAADPALEPGGGEGLIRTAERRLRELPAPANGCPGL